MSDANLLLAGIFCFALTVIGLTLTVYEFKKISRSRIRPSASQPVESFPPHGARAVAARAAEARAR